MPYGKRRVHSVSGRHNDKRSHNAPGFFRKASETFFFISDLYQVDTDIVEVQADILRRFLLSLLYPR